MSEDQGAFNYSKIAEAIGRNPRKYNNFRISNELLATSAPAKGEEPKINGFSETQLAQYNAKFEIPAKSRFSAEKLKFFLAKEYITQTQELKEDYAVVYEKSFHHTLIMNEKKYTTAPIAINIYRLTQDFTGKIHPSGAEIKLVINALQALDNYYVAWTDKATRKNCFSKLISIDQIETPQDNPDISSTIFHISLYPVFTRNLESGYSTAEIGIVRKTTKAPQLKLYELLLKAPKTKDFIKDYEDLLKLIFSRENKSNNPQRERAIFWEAVEMLKNNQIIKSCTEEEGKLIFKF